jgi:hypothetical protein
MLIGQANGPFLVTTEFQGRRSRTRHQQRGIALLRQV